MYCRQKLRSEFGIPMDAKVLLSVGELNENKNHQIVLRALKELYISDIHYLIVGQGPILKKLILLADELNIEKQVHFLGYRDDVAEIYQVADMFVFPSKREGLSVALMEAIACRVPVICTDIRGNIDLIKNSQCWFSADDKDSLIQCIKKACGKGDGSKISEECRQTAEENYEYLKQFDLQNVKSMIFKIYQETERI